METIFQVQPSLFVKKQHDVSVGKSLFSSPHTLSRYPAQEVIMVSMKVLRFRIRSILL